jgi:hypothetical protein
MRSGQFWQGEMPFKYAQEQRQTDAEKQAAMRTVLAQIGQMPGTTPQTYLKTAMDLGVPNADVAVRHGAESLADAHAARLAGILGPVYSQFADKPDRAQKALNMLWQAEPGMQDPMVLEKLQPRIDTWNAALAQPGEVAQQTQGEALIRALPGAVWDKVERANNTVSPVPKMARSLWQYLRQPAIQ